MEDLKHRLEIAFAIKRTSCVEMSKKWGVSHTQVWRASRDPKNSAPLYKIIQEFISDAEQWFEENILINEAA